ncbi:hypothetical protein DXT57_12055 [Stenotrophomonas maltophilia]|nr:hypothetical protein DXT57_12055 [Stenotrophomonas maltophilia]
MYGLGASAGLHPAPAVVPAAGRQLQRQRQKLVSCGMAGRHSALVGVDLGRHGRSRPCVDERCKACRSVGVGSRCCATGSDPFVEFVQCKTDPCYSTSPSSACNPGSHCLPG